MSKIKHTVSLLSTSTLHIHILQATYYVSFQEMVSILEELLEFFSVLTPKMGMVTSWTSDCFCFCHITEKQTTNV